MTAAGASRRPITILGSTGSIGTNTLDVVERLGGREAFEIAALTGNGNIALLAEQAVKFGARLAVTASDNHYSALKDALSGSGIAVAAGKSGLIEAASMEAGWVMAAIVGTAGLAPTLAAAERGADIALANKECLVSAGTLFIEAVRKGDAEMKKLLDDVIAQTETSGKGEAIYKKWFMSPIPPKNLNLDFAMSEAMQHLFAHPNAKIDPEAK